MLKAVVRAVAYFFNVVQGLCGAVLGTFALRFIAQPSRADLIGVAALLGLMFVGIIGVMAMRLSPFADDPPRDEYVNAHARFAFRGLALIGGIAQCLLAAAQLSSASPTRRIVLEWLTMGPVATLLSLWFSRTRPDGHASPRIHQRESRHG